MFQSQGCKVSIHFYTHLSSLKTVLLLSDTMYVLPSYYPVTESFSLWRTGMPFIPPKVYREDYEIIFETYCLPFRYG